MHLEAVSIENEKFPVSDTYPFNLEIIRNTPHLDFGKPVTLFVGENGTGKSTLLRAIAVRCGIHIWEAPERQRKIYNPYERQLFRHVRTHWKEGPVTGSFFAAEIFRHYAENLDEWDAISPGTLKHFGGDSLITRSHGQSHMAYFKNRFKIKGIYFMDEPENALSPKRQLELVEIIAEMASAGHAQFIISTHSPILLSIPGAEIYSFDREEIERVLYEDTDHYRVYRDFFLSQEKGVLSHEE